MKMAGGEGGGGGGTTSFIESAKDKLVRNTVRRCVRENFTIFLKDTENGKN